MFLMVQDDQGLAGAHALIKVEDILRTAKCGSNFQFRLTCKDRCETNRKRGQRGCRFCCPQLLALGPPQIPWCRPRIDAKQGVFVEPLEEQESNALESQLRRSAAPNEPEP